jgi:flagellar hook-associated protein 3 FlgL
MRISTSMMMNQYSQILQDKMGDIEKYSNQVYTGRSFERASDDPVAAMETIQASHEYVENKQFQTNSTNVSSLMQATESTVDQVNDILKSAQEKATEAINGTDNTADDSDIATSMQDYQSELVTTLNSQFGGKYIFGEGTDGAAPFKMGIATNPDGSATTSTTPQLLFCDYNAKDANGNPTYLSSNPTYIPVSNVSDSTGTTVLSGMTSSDVSNNTLSMPVDLNLGIQVSSSNGSIQQGTAFDAATSGLSTIISGWTDGTSDGSSGGTATNIVDQLTGAISDLNSGNISGLSDLIGNVQDAQSAVLKVDVGIGEKNDMLSFVSGKLTDDQTNITTQMDDAMEVDPAQAITQYNMSETVYKEALSVSSTVLQESLIDFLK